MIVVTIAMGQQALKDVRLLLWGLEKWHSVPPRVFLYTDDGTAKQIPAYKGKLHVSSALNSYAGLNRQQMEKLSGSTYKTKWTDFMCEKINAIRWAFREADPGSEGVWFLDADICLLAPLPTIPSLTEVALAPHLIRPGDEAKYGKYNGGFLWIREPRLLDVWAEATHTSRFFEQAALESVASSAKGLYEFPIQTNFGWWRLFQSVSSPQQVSAGFGFLRNSDSVGLVYQGKPLASIHTHFFDTADPYTQEFNRMILGLVEKLGKHPPAQEFLRMVRSLR